MNVVTPMEQQPIYTEDWIGLQELNNQNKLVFLVCQVSCEYCSFSCHVSFLYYYLGSHFTRFTDVPRL